MRYRLYAALSAIASAVALHSFSIAQPVAATEMIGLTDGNNLVSFDSNRPASARQIQVSGVDGTLIGIDVRPANQQLYGVTNTSKIYTIDPMTGMTTMVSSLNSPFKGGLRSGVDFNPVADRLRLVGANGQNFRINVETGAVTTDKPLAYARGDRYFGNGSSISAGAYTNSVAGAKSTQLFNIDSNLDILVLQNPPNDGTLKTIGMLNANFSPMAGVDITTDANGMNTAFAVSGSTLYRIDLTKGAAQRTGTVSAGNRRINLIDVTAMPLPSSSAAMPKP